MEHKDGSAHSNLENLWKSMEIRRLRRLMSENFTFVCSRGKIRMNLPIFIPDIFIVQFSNKLHTDLKFDSEFSPEKLPFHPIGK